MRAPRVVRLARWRRARGQQRRTVRRLARAAARTAKGRPPRRPVRVPHPARRTLLGSLLIALLTVVEAVRGAIFWIRGLFVRPARPVLPLLSADEFLVVGHRGAPAHEPENTLPSFARAVADGANAVEADVCVTHDGEVVVWHDADPDETVSYARAAGAEFDVAYRPVGPPPGHPYRKPVRDLSLAELRAHYGLAPLRDSTPVPIHLPTLDELVAWAAHTGSALRCVLLDLKLTKADRGRVQGLITTLDAALARHRPACSFLLMTPVLEILQEARRVAPDRGRTFDVEIRPGRPLDDDDDPDPRWLPHSAVRRARRLGNDHASLGRPRFTLGGWPTYTKTLRRDLEMMAAGQASTLPRQLIAWTLNRPRERRHLLRLGIHGILTDFPADLRREHTAEWARQQPARTVSGSPHRPDATAGASPRSTP